ncbi:MAG: ABC transporter permease [Candidatus Thermoplasmatota archaeon]|nr:ABC transporter permease [Candidatus Thermoplasmatota archaeon]
MVHWDDLKANIVEVLGEFKQHKIGIIGVSIITFMVIIGVLAPIIAPNAPEEWDQSADRWESNPANAPPHWVDWLTTEDYAHQEEINDYELTDKRDLYPLPGNITLRSEYGFQETGDVNISIVHSDSDTVIEQRQVTVEERENPYENITVNSLEVNPVEETAPEERAPLMVEVVAAVEHTGEDESRNVSLEIDGARRDVSLDENYTWELDPGEERTLTPTYTFKVYGLYSVALADKAEVVKVGNDIRVTSFTASPLEGDAPIDVSVQAELRNFGDEEQTIRLRSKEDDSVFGEWTLGPGERDTVTSNQPQFEEKGTYTLIMGSKTKTIIATGEESEEDTEEGSELLSAGTGADDGLEQDVGTNIEINWMARPPYTIENGSTIPIDFEVVNEIEQRQNISLLVDGEEIAKTIVPRRGTSQVQTLSFTYDMQADIVPKDIFIQFSGSAANYQDRIINIERPDGHTMEQIENNYRGYGFGDFTEKITIERSGHTRDNIYKNVRSWLRSDYPVDENPDLYPESQDVSPTEIIFSNRSKTWLSDPEPEKGEYKINVTLEGVGLNVDDAKLTIAGAVFGILGTDSGRRDIFQGWVWGARYGLIAGGLVAITTVIFGTLFGMTSAYYGGWVDELMQRINEILMGIPTLPILIITLQFWNNSIWVFVLIYSLLMWRGAAKVIRSRGLQVAQDTYIEAAESLGSGSGRIIVKHMIPQILPYAIAQAALLVPIVIMAEAGLHILGLGDPSIVTWGTLLTQARDSGAVMNPSKSWFWILFPGLGMILVGFGFISTGMAIERIINPKMKQR